MFMIQMDRIQKAYFDDDNDDDDNDEDFLCQLITSTY